MVLEDQRQMVRPEARIAGQERPAVHGADTGGAGAAGVRVAPYRRGVRGRPRLGPSRRPPPPLCSGDLASSTLTWRPSRSRPLKRVTASCASSAVAISTKPKPRDRPVPVSVTTVADSTTPAAAKTSRRRSLVTENGRPPTNSLCAITCPLATSSAESARPRWRKKLRRRGLVGSGSRLSRRVRQRIVHRKRLAHPASSPRRPRVESRCHAPASRSEEENRDAAPYQACRRAARPQQRGHAPRGDRRADAGPARAGGGKGGPGDRVHPKGPGDC